MLGCSSNERILVIVNLTSSTEKKANSSMTRMTPAVGARKAADTPVTKTSVKTGLDKVMLMLLATY